MKREQNSRNGREQLLMLTDLWEQVNKEHNQNDFLFKEQLTKKEYVQSGGLSKKAMYYQADHSGHYIHFTEPELILDEAERMLLL